MVGRHLYVYKNIKKHNKEEESTWKGTSDDVGVISY